MRLPIIASNVQKINTYFKKIVSFFEKSPLSFILNLLLQPFIPQMPLPLRRALFVKSCFLPSFISMGIIPTERKMLKKFFTPYYVMLTVLYNPAVFACGKVVWINLWRLWKSYCFQHLLGVFPIQTIPMNTQGMYV
jgi:hypothetical protein